MTEHLYFLRAVGRSRFFARKFVWTGGDIGELPELMTPFDKWGYPTQRIHGPLIKDGQFHIMLIDLGRTIEVGEDVEVHFRHNLKNLNATFKPFFGHGLSLGGTEHISLGVVLPVKMQKKVTYNIYIKDSNEPLDTPEILHPIYVNSEYVKYEKSIDTPPDQTNRMMKIEWE
jgi:hypothetical protein